MKKPVMTAFLLASAALAQTSGTTAPMTGMAMPPAIKADAAKKTVQVTFVAGHGTTNNGLNYNGDAKGEKTLTVPLGWTVEVTLNNTGRMPHDFAVIAGSTLPANPFTARLAFPNAATTVVPPAGSTAAPAKFIANRPGTYFILCRVGKHAQNGMYVKMQVVNGAKAVTYQ
ncbi:sulfocyanin-like copper-binding protein [Deinococcus navajonensis]|uniref:Sulfocyanin-like copper-binding protein n=1 Tax=Deinococcus navajonensis TaxID=309884 RepID=A0ABV8XJE4_9DEIO